MAKKTTKKKTVKKKKKRAAAKKSASKPAAAAQPAEKAADSAGVNKSQAIRDLMAAHPRLKPAAIAERLKEQGIHVSAQYVSTIKSNTKKQKRRSTAAAAPARLPRDLSVEHLLEVRDMVDSLGGLTRVQRALDVLKELQ